MGEAGETGAGVVNGKAHSEQAKPRERAGKFLIVVHPGLFGQLDDDPVRRGVGQFLAQLSREDRLGTGVDAQSQ